MERLRITLVTIVQGMYLRWKELPTPDRAGLSEANSLEGGVENEKSFHCQAKKEKLVGRVTLPIKLMKFASLPQLW